MGKPHSSVRNPKDPYFNRRPETLDERLAEMKNRHEEHKSIPQYAENKRRISRLEAIRKRLGLTQVEFAYRIGCTHGWYIKLVSTPRIRVTTAFLMLAEQELEKFISNQNPDPVAPNVPKELLEDTKLRDNIIRMYCTGKGVSEIATELALRPEIVQYFCALIID